GAGRTGPFWAWQASGEDAAPDLIAAGKGLGGGVAVAALLGRAKPMEAWAKHVGATGESPYASTYYAHPLACAGGSAALPLLESTAAAATEAARAFERGLAPLRTLPGVGDVRQAGLLIAIELVADRESRAPDPARAASIVGALRSRGLLVIPGGRGGNVLSLYPSRRITGAQVARAVELLAEALRA
ncbi:MAG TPA: aminotransferase class III-fold pyridoxal phosphate-dependent enzyme, partial [Candidatus Eisenbacteria bacterium]|nr:aminotransferase class III-fold pyridoxal phosphate-dependent enzyme [Candidatus Eisenbacteria bacterium]